MAKESTVTKVKNSDSRELQKQDTVKYSRRKNTIPRCNKTTKNKTNAQLWTASNSVMLEDCIGEVTENEIQFSKSIWAQMKAHGFCMLEKFLEESTAKHVEEDVLEMYRTDLFRGGEIVKQGSNLGQNVRTDTIAWADLSSDNCKGLQALCRKLDRLVKLCSKLEGKEIESRTKPMVSCYAGNGAHYKRHIDNPAKDGRRLTCIYYLNRNWNPKVDGGNLCIYPKHTNKKVVCLPLYNKIILFFSDDRNPHEVSPTYKKRFAITCWYFDKDERELALAQYATSSRPLPKEVVGKS